jgi:RNA polymerase sigma factor (sigma-70 family)
MVSSPDPRMRNQPRAADSHTAQPLVILVDDDALMLSAVRRVLQLAGYRIESYSSGPEMLARAHLEHADCAVIDMSMPEMNGLQLQACIKQRDALMPLLFLSGTADIEMAVQAMRAGAVDFIEKPFDNADLVQRVGHALARQDRNSRREEHERHDAERRFKTLTPRETEVLELVVAGKTNKEVARILGSSHRTIEVHRHRIMEKMSAPNLADLVRMRLTIGADSPTA